MSSIKYLAPRIYSSQYRAVTANDYTGIIPFVYPNVESVTAYGGEELDPPEYGKVFISINQRMVLSYHKLQRTIFQDNSNNTVLLVSNQKSLT